MSRESIYEKIPRPIRYILGLDYMRKQFEKEASTHEVNGHPEPQHALPLDSGIGPAADIYMNRLQSVFVYAGVLACRATGIDAVYRVTTNKEFPK